MKTNQNLMYSIYIDTSIMFYASLICADEDETDFA